MEVRTGYKRTEVGVIPEDWESISLGDFAAVTAGGTPSRTNAKYWNGDIPWVTTADVDFCTINRAEQFITREGLSNSAAKLLPVGTLLMALYGQGKTRGKVAVLGMEAATNQACAAIALKPAVSREFVFHFLASKYEAIRNLSNTGNQENLNSSLVRSISVLLPPESEQRAIASALSDVDALLDGLDRLIAKKRDLKQAAMQQLLTGQTRLHGFQGEWEVKPIGSVVNIQKGQLITAKTLVSGDVPVIAGGKQPAYFHAIANRFGRTITISASGASAGYVAMHEGPIFASDCSTISEADGYSLDFVYYQLLLKQGLIYKAQTGGAQPHIHAKDVNPILFLVPHVDEQLAIADVLRAMDAELTALEARRDKTRALKQGMMQELLTGRTRLV